MIVASPLQARHRQTDIERQTDRHADKDVDTYSTINVNKRSSGWINFVTMFILHNSPGAAYNLPTTYDHILVTRSSATSRDHMPDEVRLRQTKRRNLGTFASLVV